MLLQRKSKETNTSLILHNNPIHNMQVHSIGGSNWSLVAFGCLSPQQIISEISLLVYPVLDSDTFIEASKR